MPRVNIYLSTEVQKRLAEYREREWGSHHSLSAIVKKAIREFLDFRCDGNACLKVFSHLG